MREKPLILLVDDEDNFLEIIGTKLGASGFDVATAHNATEAYHEASKLLPDLILMDIHMPGMTGTDAALTIKQNEKTKDIKIAFLTSLNDPWPGIAGDRAEVSKEMGMIDFLKKDDDLDKILEKVKKLLAFIPVSSVPATATPASEATTPTIPSLPSATPAASDPVVPTTAPTPPSSSEDVSKNLNT